MPICICEGATLAENGEGALPIGDGTPGKPGGAEKVGGAAGGGGANDGGAAYEEEGGAANGDDGAAETAPKLEVDGPAGGAGGGVLEPNDGTAKLDVFEGGAGGGVVEPNEGAA